MSFLFRTCKLEQKAKAERHVNPVAIQTYFETWTRSSPLCRPGALSGHAGWDSKHVLLPSRFVARSALIGG